MGKTTRTFYSRVIKRFIDFVIALVAIIILSPLLLVVSLLIYIKLGSPVIFKQQRPGRIDTKTGKETIFNLYKFRSMLNTRDAEGNLLPDKERLTKFGHILRSSSLDELPELWNILVGDMSIVGPRPWAVSYLDYYTPEEHLRHMERPGLTGLAQVNGRTAAGWDERLKNDLQYVNNISFSLDIKIIILTVKKVLSHSDLVEAGEQGDFDVFRKKQWEEGKIPEQ